MGLLLHRFRGPDVDRADFDRRRHGTPRAERLYGLSWNLQTRTSAFLPASRTSDCRLLRLLDPGIFGSPSETNRSAKRVRNDVAAKAQVTA